MQQKAVHKLAHGSGPVVSSAASLKWECDEIRVKSGNHREQLSDERECGDSLKAQATDIISQVIKVGRLLCLFRSKEMRALAEVKTLDAQRSSVVGHQHKLRSKVHGFQIWVAGYVKDGL